MSKILIGNVVSVVGNCSLKVVVINHSVHILYKKHIKRKRYYICHNVMNEIMIGDVVRIKESRPISKTKRWSIVSKVSS